MKPHEDDDLDEYFIKRDMAMQRNAGLCLRTPWCSCVQCSPDEGDALKH